MIVDLVEGTLDRTGGLEASTVGLDEGYVEAAIIGIELG